MRDDGLVILVVLFVIGAFGAGWLTGSYIVGRDCVRGNTVEVDGKLYRANCTPEPENTDE